MTWSKDVEARKELEKLARKLNPALPEDLSGYLLHISMGKHACTAWVTRTSAGKPRLRTFSGGDLK